MAVPNDSLLVKLEASCVLTADPLMNVVGRRHAAEAPSICLESKPRWLETGSTTVLQAKAVPLTASAMDANSTKTPRVRTTSQQQPVDLPNFKYQNAGSTLVWEGFTSPMIEFRPSANQWLKQLVAVPSDQFEVIEPCAHHS